MSLTRIHHASIHARAPSAEGAFGALHATEQALRDALARAAAPFADEVLFIRKLDLHLRITRSSDAAPITRPQLERSLSAALQAKFAEARDAARTDAVSTDVAWFPNEAAVAADYLVAIAQNRSSTWPFSTLSAWGTTWPDVLAYCLGQSKAMAGAALALALEHDPQQELLRMLAPEEATRWVALWLASSATTPAISVPEPLLSDARRAVEEALRAGLVPAYAELLGLGHLLRTWPPLRDATIARNALEVAPVEREVARFTSNAGGLLAWSLLLDTSGLADALRSAYRAPRSRNAVLWAIGRCLERGGLHERDPLLLMWAGEEPDARALFGATLANADPEPLHRLALRVAHARGWLATSIEVANFGATVVMVNRDGICVDAIEAASAHDAVPSLVQRSRERAGVTPSTLELPDRPSSAVIDFHHDVDVPALPEAWRPACRAFSSLLRRLAKEQWGASLRDLRGWEGSLALGEDCVVDLKASDLRQVPGLRMPSAVRLEKRGMTVRW